MHSIRISNLHLHLLRRSHRGSASLCWFHGITLLKCMVGWQSVQQEKMFGRPDILKLVDLRYSSKKDNYICKLFIDKNCYMHFLPLVFFMESRKQFMCLLLEIPLRVLSSDKKRIKYELSGVCYGTFYEEWIVTFRNLLVHLNFFQNPMWSFYSSQFSFTGTSYEPLKNCFFCVSMWRVPSMCKFNFMNKAGYFGIMSSDIQVAYCKIIVQISTKFILQDSWILFKLDLSISISTRQSSWSFLLVSNRNQLVQSNAPNIKTNRFLNERGTTHIKNSIISRQIQN